jgi:hypothetical protein
MLYSASLHKVIGQVPGANIQLADVSVNRTNKNIFFRQNNEPPFVKGEMCFNFDNKEVFPYQVGGIKGKNGKKFSRPYLCTWKFLKY